MKRLLLTAFAVSMGAGGALAADIAPVIPPPPVVVVPAPDPTSLYISAFGGLALIRNAVWYQPDPEVAVDLRGFRIGGAIGVNPGAGLFSFEGEATWARLRPTRICFDFNECRDVEDQLEDTHLDILTLMANLRVGPNHGTLRPYVAVGAGMARVAIFSAPGDFGPDGVGPGDDDNTDWTFGFQAMAGVDFAISDNFLVGARYRFQRLGATNFIDGGGDPFTIGPLNVHSLEAGITIRFGG
ncbi:MAG: porin family protein [Bauldia sp.]|nr:porin family protein [Bauldia sp.]